MKIIKIVNIKKNKNKNNLNNADIDQLRQGPRIRRLSPRV